MRLLRAAFCNRVCKKDNGQPLPGQACMDGKLSNEGRKNACLETHVTHAGTRLTRTPASGRARRAHAADAARARMCGAGKTTWLHATVTGTL